MNVKLGIAAAVSAVFISAQASTAFAENLNADLLVSNCVVCHGDDGISVGSTPSIDGIAKDRLVAMLQSFKDGSRSGTIMARIAPGYSDAQLEVIAGALAGN